MWYDSPMGIEDHIRAAEAAVRHAQDVRTYHRRRTAKDSPQREVDLETARARVRSAMRPLRSFMGRASYGPPTSEHEALVNRVREVSRALQAERRKIWKMQQRKDQ